ncbi:MAG: nitroreductase family protein [Desulfobacterales bacterium]|nr:nitroreductase family protein [Desulfobacterales bacterium]
MAELMEVIKTRRSVRKYDEKDVPEEVLNSILEAVRWSPSWANTQCWEVVVIRDKTIKENLKEAIFPKNPATNAITQAPLLLAVCGKLKSSGFYNNIVTTKFGDWFMFDLGLFTQTLCLAAQALGLGTVVVGLFDHDKAKGIIKVPEGYELVALVPLGYPAKISSAPQRREIREFVHQNTF